MARRRYEVVIVGAGIAGASLAYFLARHGLGDVLLLEREQQLARHSTGRSAATLSRFDTHPTLLALKVLAAPFFEAPPPGFAEHPLLRPIGALLLLDEAGRDRVAARESDLRAAGLPFELVSRRAARALVPALERGFAGGLWIARDGRLDVHEILGGYLRHARAAGAELRLGAEVRGLLRRAGRVVGVRLADEEIEAGLVVDAAGAWAGEVARMAEASPIPIAPHRRTLLTFAGPEAGGFEGWPLVASEPHELYFVPEAGELMLSPMDEEEMPPCDPAPDEEVIAAALDRLGRLAPALVPRSVRRRWSGLRSFAPDRAHVVGEDPRRPGFFWLAGQGGCGIETSPAVGSIAADLIVRGGSDAFDCGLLAPERFASEVHERRGGGGRRGNGALHG